MNDPLTRELQIHLTECSYFVVYVNGSWLPGFPYLFCVTNAFSFISTDVTG